MQRIVNPYFCYVFSFALALGLYALGWSDLYPVLSVSLVLFILLTIGVYVVIGIKWVKKKSVEFRPVEINNERSPFFITMFIYTLWAAEFIYEGGIPLLKILLRQPYDYRLFGVPSLHVFVVTFSSFYTIVLFHFYLSKRSPGILILYILNLAAALLIYNRGMLLFNISATALLYLLTKPVFSLKRMVAACIAIPLLLFFFGMLGSLRSSRHSNEPYSNNDILHLGGASKSFRNSFIPEEFFWSYIYITSPLANLQTNINTFISGPATSQRFAEMINNEVFPDFISKRINRVFSIEREKENTLPDRPFNVSTVYSRCYSYLGWGGMFIMACVIMILPVMYIRWIASDSPFFLTGLVILSTMFLFMAFDNTLRFTGISFQLMFPIFLNLVFLWFPRLREIFA